jgi:hypothetical protein
MLIIAGMSGVDIIYGLGALTLGYYRVFILSQGEENDMITEWSCITLPPYFLANLGVQLTSVMNVVVSIDRLIAIAWPLRYRHLDRRYAIKVLVRMKPQ